MNFASAFACVFVSVFVFASLGVQSSSRAVDYFWNKSNGGAFGVASNWSFGSRRRAR